MELFEPKLVNAYIWACSEKKDRSLPQKIVFRATTDPSFDRLLVDHNQLSSFPVGKYDEMARWSTYCQAIDGIHGGLARYVLHPLADQAMQKAIRGAY